MIDISIDTSGLQAGLAQIQKKLGGSGLNRVLEGAADMVVDSISGKGGIFDREGEGFSDNGKWAESKAARRRRETDKAGKTLHEHGNLQKNIHRTDAKNGEIYVGSDMPYAAIHHFGGTTGRGGKTNLPARPYLGIDKKTEERILSFIKNELQ